MHIKRYGWIHRLLIKLTNRVKEAEKELDLYKTALEHAYEGVVMVDKEGYITSINETYASFLGTTIDEVIGKHVTEVIENTRMHIVVKTGVPELTEVQHIKGGQMIAHRIPIKNNKGEVVAAVGKVLFQDVDDLFTMNAKFEKLKTELEHYKRELNRRVGAKYSFNQIIGQSPQLNEVKELARNVSSSPATVLLVGESGTGKELFAHAIHQESKRAYGPFIRVNCAAIPETLFESELFGYKEGSFTGARKTGKKGKFALAHKGTIFLDEISEMPLNMQVKLLRVLQEKEIEPVGADVPEPVDVRVIAATNKNLEELVAQGKFRQDLYYRLNVITLEIPPLRERKEDIPLMVKHILQELRKETGIKVTGISEKAERLLMAYDWPGNVRELRNVLERALYVKKGEQITEMDLPPLLLKQSGPSSGQHVAPKTLKELLEEKEAEIIQRVLAEEGNDKLATAQRLGISKSSIYAKLNKYNRE
ncbi:transcriptional regulator with PAS, ATPase and Fis domain [Caldalkalibacillus uzonensis]|uniref:Transcriptional regulator with PAS, ATPase and Fis domain n=1 Tax=Caldalkalibacillus uzonensis TaxID=353224 RepID=A0ABU0CNB9_9BACI|nr:sigma 54-interacting transcriptional regulator [Caldalkalibacillus uzonensis]MDQ0337918.1 transcriptional regulator with PAS, ATPase and Fis domain [Caldalkalibacillus uzonensis]